MSENPLHISLDTQFLVNFILGSEYMQKALEKAESKYYSAKYVTNRQHQQEQNTKSLKFYLSHYIYLKFIEKLGKEGKIKINITPPAMSEVLAEGNYIDNVIYNIYRYAHRDRPIRDIIDAETINGIIDNLNISQDEKEELKKLYTGPISKSYTSVEFDDNISRSNNILGNKLLQPHLIKLLKKHYIKTQLEQNHNMLDLLSFTQFDKTTSNPLCDMMLELSEFYRNDPQIIVDNEVQSGIPAEEITDSVIMACCSLLSMPLLTGDYNGLVNHEKAIDAENENFKKIKGKQTIVNSKPFSLKQFIADFFKEDFLAWIDDFAIPSEISGIITQEIKDSFKEEISNIETRDLTHRKTPSCKENREKFQFLYSKAISSQDVLVNSVEEMEEEANEELYTKTKGFVPAVRTHLHQNDLTIMLHYLQLFDQKRDNLELLTIGRTRDKNGNITTLKSQPTATQIAQISQDTFLTLTATIQAIFNQFYGVRITEIDGRILMKLHQMGFAFKTTQDRKICAINYNGIQFTQYSSQEYPQKQLEFIYNPNDLTPTSIVLLATNPAILQFCDKRNLLGKNLMEHYRKFKTANNVYGELYTHPSEFYALSQQLVRLHENSQSDDIDKNMQKLLENNKLILSLNYLQHPDPSKYLA